MLRREAVVKGKADGACSGSGGGRNGHDCACGGLGTVSALILISDLSSSRWSLMMLILPKGPCERQNSENQPHTGCLMCNKLLAASSLAAPACACALA